MKAGGEMVLQKRAVIIGLCGFVIFSILHKVAGSLLFLQAISIFAIIFMTAATWIIGFRALVIPGVLIAASFFVIGKSGSDITILIFIAGKVYSAG